MSTEFVASLGPLDFQREMSLGSDPELVLTHYHALGGSPPTGSVRGLSLPRYLTSDQIKYGYTAAFRIPDNLTMGTGLTFTAYLTDDGTNPADLGLAVYLGFTGKYLAANAVNSVDVGTGVTEEFMTATLSSTTNGICIGTLAITSAHMNTPVVGGLVLLRVRRLASNAADTCLGRAILLRVDVANT
jgi:hypothetical protein